MIVDLLPTPDQEMIADAIIGMLDRHFPVTRLLDEHAPHDQTHWTELVESGVFAMALPESAGGAGYGVPEQVIVARELGKRLVTPAVLTTMVAAHVGDATMASAFASGAARAAPALPNAQRPELYQLHDAHRATHLLLWNESGGVLQPKPGGKADNLAMMDGRLSGETLLCDPPAWRDPALGHLATLLYAAYLVGIAEACCDRAVEYVKIREQFGRPIGSFQAIKHQCADMLTRARSARAQCYHAALMLDANGDEAGADITAARLLSGDAAVANARANIQLHGAMGFTFEAEEHHFLKRAHVMAATNFDHSAASRILLDAS